ncbi:MAG TPA: restriction endonuclease subunit S, partial [bacterium]
TRTSETAAEVGITSVMLDDTIDTVFSGFVLRARPKDNSLVDQFKKYCFSTIEVRRQITSQSSETTRALTNGRSLAAVSIARPTKVEQEAIAEALSDADALIESLEQLIAKKHLIKQGAMQELLTGKKRLPVFEVKPGFKKSEVGLIPEDWLISKIDDFCVVIRGASPRPKGDKRFYGGSIPRLMVEDVTRDGKTVIPQIDFLTEEGVKRSRPCKKGTLTIVCSGTVGIPSFLGVDACIHDGFLALVSIRKSISDEYLYHQLCRLRESFESSATHGGIFTNLTTSGVREFKLLIPSSKDEQDAIATILSDMDSEIIVLETKLNKALQVKQGMMQELLTGRIRLV